MYSLLSASHSILITSITILLILHSKTHPIKVVTNTTNQIASANREKVLPSSNKIQAKIAPYLDSHIARNLNVRAVNNSQPEIIDITDTSEADESPTGIDPETADRTNVRLIIDVDGDLAESVPSEPTSPNGSISAIADQSNDGVYLLCCLLCGLVTIFCCFACFVSSLTIFPYYVSKPTLSQLILLSCPTNPAIPRNLPLNQPHMK